MLTDVLNSTHSSPAKNGRSRRRRRASLLSKYIWQVLIGCLTFFLTAFLLGRLIPSPVIPPNIVFISPKYEYYQAHKDDYDTLFFGSSRIYSQVIPKIFDETIEAEGRSLNSYNFGIPAMRAIDSAVLLKEVLANPPKNLKWVFFESTLDKGYEPIHNARTPRSIYWHNWENTQFAARYVLGSDESLPNKAVLLYSHLLPCFYHYLSVGRLFNQWLPSDFSEEELGVAAQFTADEGFYALSDESTAERQHFLSTQQDYLDRVSVLAGRTTHASWYPKDDGGSDGHLSANKVMLLNQVVEAVRAAGAEPIFIDPPSLYLDNDFQLAKQLGIVDRLLTYRAPDRYPQLYAPENRYDIDHLNQAGAEAFSQLIAQDFSRTQMQPAVSVSSNNL